MELLSKIGLGSVQFGIPYGVSNTNGQTSALEVSKILTAASGKGIKFIDTAPVYGNSEAVLGQNDLTTFNVVSKFMPQEAHTIASQLDQTLANLNTDQLYGYLAHRPMNLLQDPHVWEALQTLKQAKKIQKIGFSINSTKELDLLLEANMQPDIVQAPFNYFDDRFKSHLITLKQNGCEIHTRSAFLQGLFFTDTHKLPGHFNDVKEEIEMLQTTYGDNLSGVLLKYVVQQDFIDVVIIGVENEQQLQKNLNFINAERIKSEVGKTISASILSPVNWPK